jgi:hypothetical protein
MDFFELVVATRREAPTKQTGTKKGNAIDHLPDHPFIVAIVAI